MKRILGVGFLIFICAAGWEIGGRLSTDAVGLALGVLFGAMAGVPAALIALAASRRSETQAQPRYEGQQGMMQRNLGQHQQQPLIIVAGAPMQQQLPGQPAMQYPGYYQREQATYDYVDSIAYPVAQKSQQPQGRQFKLIGEKEEIIEDWG